MLKLLLDLVSPTSESAALVRPRSGVPRAAARNGKTLYSRTRTKRGGSIARLDTTAKADVGRDTLQRFEDMLDQ